MFRKDRIKLDGGIMFYVNESIDDYLKCFEEFLLEFSVRNWLCFGLYKPPDQNERNFRDAIASTLTKLRLNTKILC